MIRSAESRLLAGASKPPKSHLFKQPQRAAGRLELEICLLLASFIVGLFGSTNWVHPAWSFFALANYIWLCSLFFRIEPRGAVLVLPQLVNNASIMIALIMIEYGGEMFELGLVGRPGPWSNELNLCNLLFCCGVTTAVRPSLRMVDRRRSDGLSPVLDRFANPLAGMMLFATALIAVAMILRGLQSGFPLLAGIDRFAFRRFSADKITLYALDFKFVIGYALGFVAFCMPISRWLRVSAKLTFMMMMVIFFLFGDKFFTQLAALSAFFGPFLYYNSHKIGQRIWIYAAAGLLAFAGVMTVTTFIYSNGFAETTAATTKRLSGRMVGQGELWFLQSSIGAPALRWNGPLIDRYIDSLSVKSSGLYALQNSIGANYFSNLYAPDYLRASLQRNGGSVTYTEVTEAMGLVLFGWVGLGVMMFALGLSLGLAGVYIAYAMTIRSIISVVFAAYVYTQLRNSIVQAAPWVIGSIYSARWLALILIIELILLVVGQASKNTLHGHRHS